MSDLCEEFTHSASLEFKAIVDRIDAIIQASDVNLDCAIKWGQLTYANHGDFHHWICAVKFTRHFVGLTFHFGGLLADPAGVLIAGTSKFGRKIEYRHIDDVDARIILGFIHQALEKLDYFKANWREIQQEG